MLATKRILRELEAFKNSGIQDAEIELCENNNMYFILHLTGKAGTPYAGGKFKIEIFMPENYPIEPPKMKFKTKIYHPNIDRLGRICLDILKQDNWSPAFQLTSLTLAMFVLLENPNLDDPLDTNVATHFKTDKENALQVAREWIEQYAIEKKD